MERTVAIYLTILMVSGTRVPASDHLVDSPTLNARLADQRGRRAKDLAHFRAFLESPPVQEAGALLGAEPAQLARSAHLLTDNELRDLSERAQSLGTVDPVAGMKADHVLLIVVLAFVLLFLLGASYYGEL